MPKKKVDVVVEDEVIENPEEVTIEEVPTVIETGVVNNGKKEYKDLLTGLTYFED